MGRNLLSKEEKGSFEARPGAYLADQDTVQTGLSRAGRGRLSLQPGFALLGAGSSTLFFLSVFTFPRAPSGAGLLGGKAEAMSLREVGMGPAAGHAQTWV